jgi:hypothetical protein
MIEKMSRCFDVIKGKAELKKIAAESFLVVKHRG